MIHNLPAELLLAVDRKLVVDVDVVVSVADVDKIPETRRLQNVAKNTKELNILLKFHCSK